MIEDHILQCALSKKSSPASSSSPLPPLVDRSFLLILMEEQQLNPLAITHLLQHTLRSLCIHESSHWLYAVFWRILPRNFPPPIWDQHDRGARGNRRNWILVWEDGFCNFAASAAEQAKSLQPELFFKMSHEIYNYGEGLIGKVAADHSHKWVYKEPHEQEISYITAWNNPVDSNPRTWEAQFQCGIKTIALVAVREGVVQLGAVNKIMEDIGFVVHLRKQFTYLESIPGVLLPHPSSSTVPIQIDGCNPPVNIWPPVPGTLTAPIAPPAEFYEHFNHHMRITPSMSSLEALLSKLPSVGPAPSGPPPPPAGCYEMPVHVAAASQSPAMGGVGGERSVAKEEVEEYGAGESSSSMPFYYYANVSKSTEEF